MSWLGGAGGIACPVGDLVRWCDAFEAGRLVNAKSRTEMLRPVTLNDGSRFDYGLGWGTGVYHGHTAHLHTGGGFGYACELLRFPGSDTTIVLLTNLYLFPFHRVGVAIARRALGIPEPASTPWPSAPGDVYAGTYRSRDGTEFKLQTNQTGLAGLVQCGEHLFHAIDDAEMRYRFSDLSLKGFATVTVETPLFPPFVYHRASV